MRPEPGVSGPAYRHIYLSPHLDDAVLSCGATIHRQARRGEGVLVITVFAASPTEGADTAFTQELRERWGAYGDPVAMRREEDLAAMRCTGARGWHLDYADCVYRLDASGEALYPMVEHIFADVHPVEADLHSTVCDSIRGCLAELAAVREGVTIYAPLTAGHHVDHLITACAALALWREGWRTACYEDYPYAVAEEPVAQALDFWAGQGLRREIRYSDPVDLAGKIDGVACYRSQISTFWQNLREMAEAIERYARQVGDGRLAEAIWHLPAL